MPRDTGYEGPSPPRDLAVDVKRFTWHGGVVLASLAVSGCSTGSIADEEGTPPPPFHSAVGPEDSLSSEVFIQSQVIARPVKLWANDRVLTLTDAREPFVHLFALPSGRHIRSTGPRGEGPSLFSSGPLPLKHSTPDSDLWLLDVPLRRVTRIPTGSTESQPAESPIQTLTFTDARPLSMDGPVDRRLYGVATGASGKLVLVRGALDSRRLEELTPLTVEDHRVDLVSVAKAYTPSVCVSPAGNRIALVYRYVGRIDILDGGGSFIAQAKVPFRFLPHVEFDSLVGNVTFINGRPDVRTAYVDCVASDDGLIALWDGGLRGDLRLPRPPVKAEIHEFAWSGDFRTAAVLDHATFAFAIPVQSPYIYTVAENPSGEWVIRRTAAGRALRPGPRPEVGK